MGVELYCFFALLVAKQHLLEAAWKLLRSRAERDRDQIHPKWRLVSFNLFRAEGNHYLPGLRYNYTMIHDVHFTEAFSLRRAAGVKLYRSTRWKSCAGKWMTDETRIDDITYEVVCIDIVNGMSEAFGKGCRWWRDDVELVDNRKMIGLWNSDRRSRSGVSGGGHKIQGMRKVASTKCDLTSKINLLMLRQEVNSPRISLMSTWMLKSTRTRNPWGVVEVKETRVWKSLRNWENGAFFSKISQV